MLKEIHEQPEALKNTILPRLAGGLPDFTSDGIPDELFTDCGQIRIIACGTAIDVYKRQPLPWIWDWET